MESDPILDSHVYKILSLKYPEHLLDLSNGSPDNGTQVQMWLPSDNALTYYYKVWFIKAVPNTKDCYTLCNLHSGTYLDLSGGGKGNGVKIQGWGRANTLNQEWVIQSNKNGSYRILNRGSNTAATVKTESDNPNGIPIVGWQQDSTLDRQQWLFKRVTRTPDEIASAFNNTLGNTQATLTNFGNLTYLCMPKTLITALWNNSSSSFINQVVGEPFESDAVVYRWKNAVNQSVKDASVRATGFGLLCGVVLARNTDFSRAKAFSFFYLLEDNAIHYMDSTNGFWDDKPFGWNKITCFY